LCNQKEKYILTSAIKYGQDHLNNLNDSSDVTHYIDCSDGKKGYVITVNDLILSGYIIADNDEKNRLSIPGKPDNWNNSFNPKTVCIRYENVYTGKNLDDYASSNDYHGKTNYQVTAKMNNAQCENY